MGHQLAAGATASHRGSSPGLERVLQACLGIVVTAAAVVSGRSAAEGGQKELIVLPLAVVVGLLLASLAITRFSWFILLLLAIRSSIDVLQISPSRAGQTSGNTVLNHVVDPSSLLGVFFLLAALLWFAGRINSGAFVRPSGLTLAIFVFWLTGVLSILGSRHMEAGALESLRILAVVVMFAVLEQLIINREVMLKVLLAAYASLVIPLGYTLFGIAIGNPATEVKSGFSRLLGTFSQSNDYARYLAFMIVFGVALFPHLHGAIKAAMSVLLLLSSVFIVLTLTIGAIVGTAIGLAIVAALQRRRGVAAGLVVAAALVAFATPSLAARVTGNGQPVAAGQPTGNSLAWRLGYWAQVLPLANANPVTGIGLNATQYETESAKQPHNDFLRAYVETGLLGLGAYVAMLGAFLGTCRRAFLRSVRGTFNEAVSVGALACVCCFAVESMAANVITNVVNLWYLVAFAAAAQFVGRVRSQSTAEWHEEHLTVAARRTE